MFLLNPVVAGRDDEDHDYQAVLDRANEEGIRDARHQGLREGSWPSTDDLLERNRPYANWYEPVDSPT